MKEGTDTLSLGTDKLAQQTVFSILFTISLSHLLNDMMQAVIPAVYPLLKQKYHLSFTQIGLITFCFQLTASILQPFVGNYTDKTPRPYSLAVGMGFTFVGLIAYHPGVGCVNRHRLVHLPSRIVAGGPHGIGWEARTGPVYLSTGW